MAESNGTVAPPTIEGEEVSSIEGEISTSFKTRKNYYKDCAKEWGDIVLILMASYLVSSFFIFFHILDILKGNENAKMTNYLIICILLFILSLWLLLFVNKKYEKLLMLEEVYAHKEAISESFLAYKNQIIDIESKLRNRNESLKNVNEVLIKKTLEEILKNPCDILLDENKDI